jgi:hypothetical protein
MGVLQSSGPTVIVLLDLSEFLEILDPLTLETGPSDFAKLSSSEQIIALCID